jgi:O-antigen ligase
VVALAVSAVLAGVLRVRQSRVDGGSALWWVAAAAVVALALTLQFMPSARIAARFSRTGVSAADRLTIWKDTLPMVRDFWLTGTGAGTYETGMLVYQRAAPVARFNQAHNHYLQVAAEGGLLLGVPVFLALGLYVREAWRRLWADRSGVFWIRAGALCGLAGAAAQSLWETGLVTPANAALAAVSAAIVIHVPLSKTVDERQG